MEEKKKPEEKTTEKNGGKSTELLSSRTGGAYIPPAKLRLMQQEIKDKNSVQFQVRWL